MILFILTFDGILAFLFANIAYKKGYPFILWGVLGFFFPILYLVLLLVPNRYKKTTEEEIIKIEQVSKNNFHNIVDCFVIFIILFLIWYCLFY